MQLAMITFLMIFLMISQEVKAQVSKIKAGNPNKLKEGETAITDISTYEPPDWKTIDIDFLSSYYLQDGNNSPVTGGIGTEQLTDFTQKVIISVPLNKKLKLNMDGGYDYYSSASTDNIDNIPSSDSSSDVRIHGNVGLTYQLDEYKNVSFRLGASSEYDYSSINGGVNFNLLSKDKNTGLSLGFQAFIDNWTPYLPSEFEETTRLATTQRQSYNASVGFTRVLNKKMQLSVQLEGIYMQGLLSTPFHRVYFQEQDQAKVELLPDSRLKVPIGIRLNSYLSEHLIARLYYRYYWDNWGVQGHTASIELPIKINRFFSIAPFYRYHQQTAANYFKPFKEHSIQDAYYTSDYDLSAFSSHSYGVGLSFSPPNGIAKVKLPFKKRSTFTVKSIDLKYSHFNRDTGLKADIISLGLSFSF